MVANNTQTPVNIAVAVSGGGRSLQNLMALSGQENRGFKVTAVIASRPDCGAVEIARHALLPTFIGDFKQGSHVGEELAAWLSTHQVQWIVLAGFLKKFPSLEAWRRRIINIHPALLPKFGGKGMYGDQVHRAVLAAQETVTGATVHFVTENYDEGQIIAQIRVPVESGDSAHQLAQRVFAAECQLLPNTIRKLIDPHFALPAAVLWRLQNHEGN